MKLLDHISAIPDPHCPLNSGCEKRHWSPHAEARSLEKLSLSTATATSTVTLLHELFTVRRKLDFAFVCPAREHSMNLLTNNNLFRLGRCVHVECAAIHDPGVYPFRRAR